MILTLELKMEIDVPLKKREDALKKREDAKLERIDWSCVIARRLKNLEPSEELKRTRTRSCARDWI